MSVTVGDLRQKIHKLNIYIYSDQLNGDLAPENGDAYFMYGKALLQYAIQQNTVLGQSAQANAVAVEEQQRETKQAEGRKRD